MAKDWMDKYGVYVIGTAMIVGILWYCALATFQIFHPSPQQNMTFNVVGIENATNSSIVSLQFECIKFCTGRDYHESCYAQCEKLGRCKE